MSKYDCSKTLDYVHERQRLCEKMTLCNRCVLNDAGGVCSPPSEKEIRLLQEWSDKHSEGDEDGAD